MDKMFFNFGGIPEESNPQVIEYSYIGGYLHFIGTGLNVTNGIETSGTITGLTLSDYRVQLDFTNLNISAAKFNSIIYNSSGPDSAALMFNAADQFTGGALDDVLMGYGGNDTLSGREGLDRLYGGDGHDIINGGNKNDQLFGDAGWDKLFGDDGNDLVTGGAGRDQLYGGKGVDNFRFLSKLDSPTSSSPDQIRDFEDGIDKINLGIIDANEDLVGSQAFRFIGSTAFNGYAGQLRAIKTGETTMLLADTDGDKIADIHIEIIGKPVLTAIDFVL